MRYATQQEQWKSNFCTAEILNDLKAESTRRHAQTKRLDATAQESGTSESGNR